MKKWLSLTVCLAIILSSTTVCFGASSIKQPKVGYVYILNEIEFDENSIGLYWNWDKKVTGYDIYVDYEGRGFEKLDRIQRPENLTISTSRNGEKKFSYIYDADYKVGKYTFKIRAYKTTNGKTYYSKFSKTKAVNMQCGILNCQFTPFYSDGHIYIMFDNWYHSYDVELDLKSVTLYNRIDKTAECGAIPVGYWRGGNTEVLAFPDYNTFAVKNDKIYTAIFNPRSNVLGTGIDESAYGVCFKFKYNGKEYLGYADNTQTTCSPLNFVSSF